ncbi:hypothetical protein BKA70DRAFT_676808 [Coprinopsis sp. MPI-PUGE-AT-0042]|nr:hypothetical protein BKA70DRAFT_676808 [Coprinopsis sp. MPI-PUGE-AT-0042]
MLQKGDPRRLLTSRCLQTLNHFGVNDSSTDYHLFTAICSGFPFLYYAFCFWHTHAKDADSTRREILTSLHGCRGLLDTSHWLERGGCLSPAHIVARHDFPSPISETILLETDGISHGKEAGYHHSTPLVIAAEHGREGVVRCIIQRQDLILDRRSGLTALRCAISGGYSEIVDLLLADRRLDARAEQEGTYSVLFACFKRTDPEAGILSKLLRYRPALDVNARASTRDTVPRRMVRSGMIAHVRCLLQHPDLDVNNTDPNDLSALDIAVMNKDRDMLDLLLKHPGLYIGDGRRSRIERDVAENPS